MRTFHHHLDPDTAERYVMGDSTKGESANVEEHILVCARCREQLSGADSYLAAFQRAADALRFGISGRPHSGWQLSRLLVVAAGLAGMMLLGILAAWYY